MVNRADVHCRPPPLHFQRSIPIPRSVHVDPREIARVPLRFHFAPAKPPRLLLPLSASNPFSNFSNGTRVCGKDFLLFLQTHFKHTFSRYQKSRNRTRKNKMIAILNVHANGNSFYISRKKTVTRSSVICQLWLSRNFPKNLKTSSRKC